MTIRDSQRAERRELAVVPIALGLALAGTIAIGFARFAYALLLPSMQSDLRWSYTFAGMMNTANAAGYLAGAVLAPVIARKLGEQRAFTSFLLLTGGAVLLTGATREAWALLSLRGVAGLCGAVAFIMGAVLSVRLAARTKGRTSGFVFAAYAGGCGLGVALSAAVVPLVLSSSRGWQFGWILLGLASLIAAIPAWVAALRIRTMAEPEVQSRQWPIRGVKPALVAYFLFAFGYIGYMTFSVALLRGQGRSPGEIAAFWVVLGISAVLAPLLWSGPIANWRGGNTLLMVLLASSAGSALPLVMPTMAGAYVSAILFGGSFLTIVAMMSALVRRIVAPGGWNAGVAMFTVIFATGQILGPVITGAISDTSGGLRTGLAFSSAILLLGGIVGLAQNERRSTDTGSNVSPSNSLNSPSPSAG
jgi:predicted MFS family arabinose efflux permease